MAMAADDAASRAAGMATGTADAAAAGPQYAWAEGIMDMIAKYDRNTERHLFVYGISVSRCVECRNRIKANMQACPNCDCAVPPKANACNRCSTPNPMIFCYDCDAYFCEPCHLKPHVLVLGGSQPEHHCFPTDGATGNLIHRGAWSDGLFSMALTARREQLKKIKDSAVPVDRTTSSKPTLPEQTTAIATASAPVLQAMSGPTEKVSSTQEVRQPPNGLPPLPPQNHQPPPPTTAVAPVQQAIHQVNVAPPIAPQPQQPTPEPTSAPVQLGPVPAVDPQQPVPSSSSSVFGRSRSPSPVQTVRSTASTTSTLASGVEQPEVPIKAEPVSRTAAVAGSRKRKAEMVDLTATSDETVQSNPVELQAASHGASGEPATEGDGKMLYTRLVQMHSKPSRIHSETQGQASTTTAVQPQRPSLPATAHQPASTPTHPPSGGSTPAQPPPTASSSADQSSSFTNVDLEVKEALARTIEAPPTPSLNLDAESSQRLIYSQPSASSNTGTSSFGASGGAESTRAAVEDPLQVAVVEEYDKVNDYICKIEVQVVALTDYVKRATTSNVSHAALINHRVNEYQRQILAADDQRIRALAKVVLFSPALRDHARGLQRQQLFDIPIALNANHKKCFELAKQITAYRTELQRLQNAIAEAAANGDVTQLIELNTRSPVQMAKLEHDIQKTKQDRDEQFRLMVQFSARLREAIHREMALIRANQGGSAQVNQRPQ